MRRGRISTATLALTAATLAACEDPVAPSPSSTGLEVVAEGLSAPVDIATAPGDPTRLYVVEKAGRIRVIRDGQLRPAPVLDLSGSVAAAGEQGLLGLAFAPDFAVSRHFFVDYTALDGTTTVARYTMSTDPESAESASAVTVLTVPQPDTNHNGGQLAFGPDGMLYVGLGDGGGGGDPDGNGQNTGTLLGSILRLDVSSLPYTIPADNPFAGSTSARPEIWAWGLRNPWRFSFDTETGTLWVADVGQGEVEEVNRLPAGTGGLNLGWAAREGTRCFTAPDCSGSGFTDPAHEYRHDEGCSVTGGYVVRAAGSGLRGRYVFGDFCSGWVRSFPVDDPTDLYDHAQDVGTISSLSTFGLGADGVLYVASLDGTVWRFTGDAAPAR